MGRIGLWPREGQAGGGLSERLDVAPPGEPPRPDELPDQPHPHHSRGDGVHSAQQGAGAGRARRLRQGGVAACSPRPTRGWVVDGQELRSPEWRDVNLDPALPLGLAPATGSLGPGRVCLPPESKGLGHVFFKGPDSSGDQRPSPPACFMLNHTCWPFSLLCYSQPCGCPLWSLLLEKTPRRGWARWGGLPVLPFCHPLSPCPVPDPVLGSGTWETEMVGGVGTQTSGGGEGRFLGGADISIEL